MTFGTPTGASQWLYKVRHGMAVFTAPLSGEPGLQGNMMTGKGDATHNNRTSGPNSGYRAVTSLLLAVATFAGITSCSKNDNSSPPIEAAATTDSPPTEMTTTDTATYTSAIGFPPAQACNFLSGNPAFSNPSSYTPFFPEMKNDYACGTKYYEVLSNPAGLSNNLSYYVRGTPESAKRIRILLNVNDESTFATANNVFQKASSDLFKSAFHRDIEQDISIALGTSTPGKWMVDGYSVQLDKTVWPTGKGFELNFIIRDPAYNPEL